MPSSISPPQLRLNAPSLNFLARRFLNVKYLYSLPVSLNQPVRRVRVQRVEVRVFPEVKEVAVDHPVVDVAEDVVAEAAVLAQVVDPVARKVRRFLPLVRSFL